MKKQSDLSRLMGYAGNYRYFTYASWVLSAISALVALVPFVYIWKILRDGQIAESGTKDELCAQNGLFARMWQDYQASVQWKVAKEG